MSRGVLDSAWPYFIAAAVLLLAAVVTQFRIDIPSRRAAPTTELRALRDRDDLNVVFLLVDTLRADRLGIYGYERATSPNIDALAEYGVVMERVVAQSSWTKTSMASLWTGTHPINNRILRFSDVLPDAAVMPAELFSAAGFRTVGLWRNGWVEPNFGFSQGFDVYMRPAPGAARARVHRRTRSPHPLVGTDEDMTIAATDFLEQFGQDRFFLYLHYMDLHQYVYDEDSAIFGTSYSDAYDQALRWTDKLIGVLVAHLEQLDVLDRTLVVIASDHGEAFQEHGFEGHARNLYEEVTHVPLILIPPFLLEPGVRVETTISNADLWPTLLDIVGLPAMESADGVSMLPLILRAGGARPEGPTEDLERPVFAQLALGWGNVRSEPRPIAAVTWGDMRGIARLDRSDRFELYDHRDDPEEAHDLYAERPEAAKLLQALLSEYVSGAKSTWGETREQVEVDELRFNQLRALGYEIKP